MINILLLPESNYFEKKIYFFCNIEKNMKTYRIHYNAVYYVAIVKV
jgi:hypothetical protein